LTFLDGKPAGKMEFMPPDTRKELYRHQKAISEDNKYTFVEPVKCQVKYRNLTKTGLLRIQSFVEWK
jgi:DNA ligase 1